MRDATTLAVVASPCSAHRVSPAICVRKPFREIGTNGNAAKDISVRDAAHAVMI
eukprot:m.1310627 g.1310627  ORF g.1310627 m.1310627 type:complete len:54 (+) comp24826_c0_seq8:398-559(+)